MQILGLLGMYFDAVVVFFTIFSLFFRMAMAILWDIIIINKFLLGCRLLFLCDHPQALTL